MAKSNMPQRPDYHKTTSRRPWLLRTIPPILKKAGKSLTLPQLTAALDMISNPSYHSTKRLKQADWEYHFGVQQYKEVELVLERLIGHGLVVVDTTRRTYDPKAGRTRYGAADALTRLAASFSEEPQKPSEPAGLLLKA